MILIRALRCSLVRFSTFVTLLIFDWFPPNGREKSVGANEDERFVMGVDQVGLHWLRNGATRVPLVVTRNEDEQSSGFVDTQALASPEASRSLNLLLWGISIAIILVVLLLTERRRSYVLPLILLLLSPFAQETVFGERDADTILLDVSPSMEGARDYMHGYSISLIGRWDLFTVSSIGSFHFRAR